MARYFADPHAYQSFVEQLPLKRCPHCATQGHLVRHGALKPGNHPQKPGEFIRRGHRFLCTNRGRRRGCGRTFSVLDAHCFKTFSLTTQLWWRFLERLRVGRSSIKAAWEHATNLFSLTTAYRLWKRFNQSQWHLRAWLSTICPAPRCVDTRPALQLIEHLRGAFAGHPDPIAAFQGRCQCEFWPPLQSHALKSATG